MVKFGFKPPIKALDHIQSQSMVKDGREVLRH